MERRHIRQIVFGAVAALFFGVLTAQYRPPSGATEGPLPVDLCSGKGLALTTSGTSKQTLVTCTIPAGSFPNATLEIWFFGSHAANANSVTMGVSVGGQDIINRISTDNAGTLSAYALCGAASATTIGCHVQQQVSSGTTSGNIYAGLIVGQTFTSPTTVLFHLTTGTQAGDATLNAYTLRLRP